MTSYTTYFSGADNRAAQVGTNLGTINFNNPSTPRRSATPPTPSLVIPYRRDPDFVERDVLTNLWQKASEPGARVALVGLGGVGGDRVCLPSVRLRPVDLGVLGLRQHDHPV
ncbi:uncharacterized protein A1O9_12917 [Exophiala aquamarina CBS 119918]|uniref:Uncharacterized protein n=1 Tax=Exophiala aquamarina CBS 119918 TaxID=1182545 RepID=A0A072NVF9_9EURO|nr:uncharacterized protein A1O9_12917 [Exophiala aquamarina CBS 119918]KEF51033.1 hypothetical protein A1O9_12917 [Exophiala aquamarina CBS 119918]